MLARAFPVDAMLIRMDCSVTLFRYHADYSAHHAWPCSEHLQPRSQPALEKAPRYRDSDEAPPHLGPTQQHSHLILQVPLHVGCDRLSRIFRHGGPGQGLLMTLAQTWLRGRSHFKVMTCFSLPSQPAGHHHLGLGPNGLSTGRRPLISLPL